MARAWATKCGRVSHLRQDLMDLTNEPTSISRTPAAASASIQARFAASGMMRSMLCSPSRGPTSLRVRSLTGILPLT